jgi:anhydro-N-acetylmuramic acid kinase
MLKAGRVWALGAMSGTSLDGVDAAMIKTDGEVIHGFGRTRYRPYPDAERAVLRAALGKWAGPEVEAAARVVEEAHVALLGQFEGAALVGFHGQTLAHEPRGRGTHQAGDGAALAGALGLPVVWDFRSADVRLGGEGAPLAPFYHFACAKWIGAGVPLAFLNLGGVGNLTWVDPRCARPEEDGALLAFDTGPANAPLNDLVQARLGQAYDRDGALARRGRVARGALELFLDEPWFLRIPPKSLDRDAFAEMVALVGELDDADAAATLTAMAAAAVMRGMEHCPAPPERVLVTGGGRANPVMMEMLRASLGCPVAPVEEAGLDGDMLEAQAFAHLAVRVARGLPTSCPGTTGVRAAVSGGTLSRAVDATEGRSARHHRKGTDSHG